MVSIGSPAIALLTSDPIAGRIGGSVVAQIDGVRSQQEIFRQIYVVFLVLGTAVGIVVIGYTLYNAYKYRASGEEADDADRPTLGELPTGGGGGGKLFVSFGLSTVIVVGLILWTYGALLDVESGPPEGADDITVEVTGYQFGWEFEYPNGATSDTLRVPEDTVVRLEVTSRDVFHNFGIPALKTKADAIPGERTDTWFIAEDAGVTYQAKCYELCGSGHSFMNAEVVVMERGAFEEWYANATAEADGGGNATGGTNATGGANGTAAVLAPGVTP